MTKIINLLGGPGVGKSTVAAGVFSELKQRKISCEYVSEYAKEVTWEETHKLLENQIHVFSEQFRRQFRLLNKVDYVITDSPLALNSIYFDYYLEKLNSSDKSWFNEDYQDLCRDFFDKTFLQFDNFNFLITRQKEYDSNGRNQSLQEAEMIDKKIAQKLFYLNLPSWVLANDEKINIKFILDILGVLNVCSV